MGACSINVLFTFSHSGKTRLLTRICKYANELFQEPPKAIFYVYCSYQKIYQDLETIENLKLFHLFDHDELRQLENHRQTLLVLDDVVDMCPTKTWLKDMYLKFSNHYSISIISIFHNLYDQKLPFCRSVQINSQVTILMSSLRSKDQIRTFASQCYTGNVAHFMLLYKEVCLDKKYGYLIINFHAGYDNRLRLMSGLIPPLDPDVPPTVFELKPKNGES